MPSASRRRSAWLAFSVLLVAAGGALWYRLAPGRISVYTDADTIRQPADSAPVRRILWQPALRLPEPLNTPHADYEPRISWDGLTLYFVRGKAGRNAEILLATRTPNGWTGPRPLEAVNSPDDELGPEPSADGQSLYFYSNRAGGCGGYDLWVTRRVNEEWQPPINLGPVVNSPFNDYGPALSPDGRSLYFASNRPRDDDDKSPSPDAWPATVREDFFQRDYDLYVAIISESGIGPPAAVTEVNTRFHEGAPAVSPVGDFLYFASDRPGGQGGFDLYRCRRLAGGIEPVENLGDCLNTPANELDPGLGLGGYGIYFSSDRAAHGSTASAPVRGRAAARPEYDLYYAASREVFVLDESRDAAPINWLGLWRAIGPNLLWGLMALLLALLLLALLRNARGRRLSLLAKCLLASLLAHLVLMILLNFWAVTSGLADALGGRRRIPVALLAPAHADALTEQIRGRLTAVNVTPVAVPRTSRSPLNVRPPAPELLAAVDPPAVRVRDVQPAAAESPIREAAPSLAPSVRPETDAVAVAPAGPVELALPDAPTPQAAPEAPIPPPRCEPDSVALVRGALPLEQTALDTIRVDPGPAAEAVQIDDDASSVVSAIHDAAHDVGAMAAQTAAVRADAWVPDAAAPPVPALPADEQAPAAVSEPAVAVAELPATPTSRPALPAQPVGGDAPTLVELMPASAGPASPAQLASVRLPEALEAAPPTAESKPPRAMQPNVPAHVARPADLPLPTETAPPADAYAQRDPVVRKPVVERGGGNEQTERAVAAALDWLARHQSRDGHWDADDFDDGCNACGGQTDITADVALTGLSLLCFLAADHTHVSDGPYQSTVERALHWLCGRQSSGGDLRGDETMYSHAIAAIALCEAAGMTHDARLREAGRQAVDFIARAPNRRVGGWRYDPGQAGDTSVLGWQVMALASARRAGIEVLPETWAVARDWLDKVRSPTQPGRYAYQPGRRPSPAMTAEAMLTRELLGHGGDAEQGQSAAYLLANLPDWDADNNTYYWYYATLALFHHGGDAWSEWNVALTRELLAHQRKGGPPAGSWDPVGEWAPTAGRIYQTALCTLMLEVYYRYLPLYLTDDAAPLPVPQPAAPIIYGRLVDATTHAPIVGGLVRLDLPGRPALAYSDAAGRFSLRAFGAPEHSAISASHAGYSPRSFGIRIAPVGATDVELALLPRGRAVVPFETAPEVHHLGNDAFEGRINSRFQRDSEGTVFEAAVTLSAEQLAVPGQAVELRLLVRGAQCPHRVYINGRLLEARIPHSPEDGSFGDVALPIEPGLLRSGRNDLRIRAVSCNGDLDDFEFVNVQLQLGTPSAALPEG